MSDASTWSYLWRGWLAIITFFFTLSIGLWVAVNYPIVLHLVATTVLMLMLIMGGP